MLSREDQNMPYNRKELVLSSLGLEMKLTNIEFIIKYNDNNTKFKKQKMV
jgi:hypothetical protein